jgi:Uncharacterised nucleotidyltransferase
MGGTGMTRDAMLLVHALRDPASTRSLDANDWTALIAMARAEQLIGTLAHRLSAEPVPDAIAHILSDARINAEHQRRTALWEAECARRALAGYAGKVVLLKGTAYVAAGLKAGQGRHIGDLDIMVARDDLPVVENALLEKGGWEWVKEDAYDDAYYRDYMHELPPMIHKERDRMIDVHHTILPLTAGPTPDAVGLLRDSVKSSPLQGRGLGEGESTESVVQLDSPPSQPSPLKRGGLYVLSPTDMVTHCATHLIADGDLAGGLRNLWDFHCLLPELLDEVMDGDEPPDAVWVWDEVQSILLKRAEHHQLRPAVARAMRLAGALYGEGKGSLTFTDRLFIRRLTARDGWGRQTRKFTRLAFYIRSHLLRMPPLMLARHLFTKWRKAKDKS